MIALASDSPVRGSCIPAAVLRERAAEIERLLTARPIVIDPNEVCTVAGCPACERVKAQPFECAACGFYGRPLTIRCDCAKSLEDQLSFTADTLNKYPIGAVWPVTWKTSRAMMVKELHALRRVAPLALCDGKGSGQPDTGARLFSFSGNCGHGDVKCPACGAYGDDGSAELDVVLALLREVRRVLGPAHTLVG
jgi:hypothetical protein